MRRPEDVEADMAQLGRPTMTLGTIQAVRRSLAEAKAWDELHPDGARRYAELVAEHSASVAAAQAEELERRRNDSIARTLEKRLGAAGLGDRQRQAALLPRETMALEAARRWWASSRAWLLLYGNSGTGKSVAAGWCVVEALKAGSSAAQRKATELARMSMFDAGADELEYLKRIHLLVIDDLGTEKGGSEWAQAVLFELLDARHEKVGLRTVLTSNLDFSACKARLGARVVDRIREDGFAAEVRGGSQRKGAA
ncbi:MAG: hypothetical protein AMXMBFR56_72910 [Polyangiaceae bacterium]